MIKGNNWFYYWFIEKISIEKYVPKKYLHNTTFSAQLRYIAGHSLGLKKEDFISACKNTDPLFH